MIASISGTVKQKTEKSLIADVGGVGYEMYCLPLTLEKAKVGTPIELLTYLHVREEAMELYGFSSLAEREFFRLLLSVSGIGPKTALAVMSLASISDLKRAIVHDDASMLIKVSGIGTKTAERLVVELKDKLGDETVEAGQSSGAAFDHQAIDAMTALGYSAREAREALRQVDSSVESASDRVKAALKHLGRK
ncbi:MAG: Holliday junction branch migration protein RuvA [Patescibacteria group bacterium]